MRVAFVAPVDPARDVSHFSGVTHHLYRALAARCDVVPVVVEDRAVSWFLRGYLRVRQALTGRRYKLALYPRVLRDLSLRAQEGASRAGADCVMAEAAAAGLPSMATSVGGVRGLFEDGEAIFLDSNRFVAEAIPAILELVRNGRLNEMGRRARRRFETHLNWDTIAARIVKELEQVAASKDGGGESPCCGGISRPN